MAIAYDYRGVAYGAKGDYQHAIADERKACELAPGNPLCAVSLIWDLYQAARYEDAVAAGRAGVVKFPGNVNIANLLAISLLSAGENDEAVAAYRKLGQTAASQTLGALMENFLKKRPDLHLVHFCLALLYDGAGRREDAAHEYQAYLDAEPNGRYAGEARQRLQVLGRRGVE